MIRRFLIRLLLPRHVYILDVSGIRGINRRTILSGVSDVLRDEKKICMDTYTKPETTDAVSLLYEDFITQINDNNEW